MADLATLEARHEVFVDALAEAREQRAAVRDRQRRAMGNGARGLDELHAEFVQADQRVRQLESLLDDLAPALAAERNRIGDKAAGRGETEAQLDLVRRQLMVAEAQVRIVELLERVADVADTITPRGSAHARNIVLPSLREACYIAQVKARGHLGVQVRAEVPALRRRIEELEAHRARLDAERGRLLTGDQPS